MEEKVQEIVFKAINEYLGRDPTDEKSAKRYAEMNHSAYLIAHRAVEITLKQLYEPDR